MVGGRVALWQLSHAQRHCFFHATSLSPSPIPPLLIIVLISQAIAVSLYVATSYTTANESPLKRKMWSLGGEYAWETPGPGR